MKQHHKVLYYNLLTTGKLNPYLADIDKRARMMFEEMVKSLTEKENVTEELKSENAMLWVQKMNNIRNRATEICTLIFCYKVLCRNLASRPFG